MDRIERRDMNAEAIRAELNTIVDPCSVAAGAPAGLVDMGLVRRLEVDETRGGCTIRLTIGLTEPGCMVGASFVARARELLSELPGVARVDVALEHDCDWSPRDLDPEYAMRLRDARAVRRSAIRDTR
ncbi:MAG TPA: iron-sulfur cluster assembly protein [Thermoleophilaceae bacterium]